jgi:hypothetical protein
VAAKRKGISKKIRFEVFKRDSFTCQYCGKPAPDVILHVDHIEPVSKGGDNEIINLITSCFDCNAGKSDRRLDDQTTLAKQRAQLAELSDRREQLELMLKWRKGLQDVGAMNETALADHWNGLLGGAFYLNENGMRDVRAMLRKHPLIDLMDCCDIAAEKYLEYENNKPTQESASFAFRKVAGIAALRNKPQDERDLYYVRGILRNRLSYLREWDAMTILRSAWKAGVPSDALKDCARRSKSWTSWQNEMDDLIQEFNE